MFCVIIDDIHELLIERFLYAGINCDYQPDIKKEEVVSWLKDVKAPMVVVRSKQAFTADVLQQLPDLRFIGRAGAGLDNIDLEACQKQGIKIVHAGEGNRQAVAEHTLGLILGLLNHIPQSHQQVKDGIWQREANRGIELSGKVVGILGYGNTGQALARCLSGMGCEILTYDKYLYPFPQKAVATSVSLEELLVCSDIISLHVPLSAETKYMAHADFFAKMKPGSRIINASRGKVLDMQALLEAIRSGHIAGAALDVLENERINHLTENQKLTFEGLKQTNKVIFTPHVAGWTTESYRKISEILADKLIGLVEKEKA